jgi:hypothetical protein
MNEISCNKSNQQTSVQFLAPGTAKNLYMTIDGVCSFCASKVSPPLFYAVTDGKDNKREEIFNGRYLENRRRREWKVCL